MAKRLIDAFSEEFFKELRQVRNHPAAYDAATEKFEKQHGFTAFDNYDSFRRKRDRKKK